MGMSLFALVWVCLQHPVPSARRAFPSAGRRRLFSPLVHFGKWFLSVAAPCLSLTPELHSTHVCPTPTCYFFGPREETLPAGAKLGWVGILLTGRGHRFQAHSPFPIIACNHGLSIIKETLWVFNKAWLFASCLCKELWMLS